MTEESHSEVQPVCALKHIAVRVHLYRELPYPIMQRTQSAGNEPELHQNHDSLYKYLNKFYSASPKYYIKHIGWLERVLKFINHEGRHLHTFCWGAQTKLCGSERLFSPQAKHLKYKEVCKEETSHKSVC